MRKARPSAPPGAAATSAAQIARHVIRLAATGSLATLDPDGAPFASLVTVATSFAGEPLLLLSGLARHSRNLARDRRASLLLVAPGGEEGDPLAGARVTLGGRLTEDADAASRRRFLARHPEASGYADFEDFAFHRLSVEGGHLVAGFGRIVDRADLVADVEDSQGFAAAEADAIAHMNADHAEALSLYATRLLGQPAGAWQTTGADPEGLDLRAGRLRARLDFPGKVDSAAALRATLAALADKARANP